MDPRDQKTMVIKFFEILGRNDDLGTIYQTCVNFIENIEFSRLNMMVHPDIIENQIKSASGLNKELFLYLTLRD